MEFMQFVYVQESLREKMLSLGYKEIMKCNKGNIPFYIFHNNCDKYSTFSIEDKRKMMFTNTLNFI